MRFTHSSLFTLTSIVTSSIVYQVSSAPVSPSDLASPESPSVALNTLSGMALAGQGDSNRPIWAKNIEKRSKHHKKHSKTHKKHHKKTTKKSKKSSSHKKKTTKRKTSKKTTKKHKTTKTTKKGGSGSKGGQSFSGDGTYYTPSLGSCGLTNSEKDLVAALNAPQMNNPANPNLNPICGKYINVHGPKGSVRVKIVDTCPPCKVGDVDLSPAAFGKIGNFVDGRIPISWTWA
ncbi:hypothetical protein BCV72DRAFT_275718 [Rhizopus microsporus var. microsporus]|uniref:RlpA-like protein double-psi beta-barrel domain-containing protein n=2 Tax=Rhizopus microsporus TaxID=58291 RepID=A0A2G4T9B1_RHIZD|nr:uncharacterized protein RHIMIDRAFT_288448 [Rhizopus microsporus ATCC 52813]ORE05822.1 hypothetical protein BCV72DRAFT_275718 [Rhizopus microsporus var. microsporus]PHZ17588.1 hypothetical protein RHIMIDRAFT_288448 [Rhizopus microsporus ATCC 52813]